MSKKHQVYIDDNYHYMDESERMSVGSFESLEDAIEKCKELTLESLEHLYEEGITPEKLHAQWLMFGDDPFIRGSEVSVPFSAREFVTQELCIKIIESKLKG